MPDFIFTLFSFIHITEEKNITFINIFNFLETYDYQHLFKDRFQDTIDFYNYVNDISIITDYSNNCNILLFTLNVFIADEFDINIIIPSLICHWYRVISDESLLTM